jgi:PKD repeat protein
VQVLGKNQTNNFPPTIHAAYAPTLGIRAGDAVTFKVRTFRTTAGSETWDFGDGSPKVEVQSDGNAKPLGKDGYAVTQHRYAKAGNYVARVERSNERGETAVARLVIEVVAP